MVTMAGAGLFSSSGGASSLNGKGTLACPIAEAGACPVFLPTKEEFEQPFGEFVSKVIPPKGWRPRKTPFPDLRKVNINVPIRQHVFGTKGAYRCLFVEQKAMTVSQFKKAAEEEAQALQGKALVRLGSTRSETHARACSSRHHRAPEESTASAAATGSSNSPAAGASVRTRKGEAAVQEEEESSSNKPDAATERAFWANVTLNPPMYGADTPTSFFDEKLSYGWNLRALEGDLLRTRKVPPVPGVTTPMTYFGMWRSFFGWHKEDADLYSINYLHWGAPKVWYGVPPSQCSKFDRMTQSMFPELAKSCPAFVRHKDIMMSPSQLRTFGVRYEQARQAPGEFVVLNAAAYHAGFNTGFNCAEAINFALKEWIAVGKAAVPCRCNALKDGVRISMRLFDPKWVDPYETDTEDDSEVEESEDQEPGSEEEASGSGSDQEDEETEAAKRSRGRPSSSKSDCPEPKRGPGRPKGSKNKPKTDEELEGSTVKAGSTSGQKRGRPRKDSDGEDEESRHKRSKVIPGTPPRKSPSFKAPVYSAETSSKQRVVPVKPRSFSAACAASLKAGVDDEGGPAVGQPCAVLGLDAKGERFFYVVQVLKGMASQPKHAMLRWLKQGRDGLYRAVPGAVWEEPQRALLAIRTQRIAAASNTSGGAAYKLIKPTPAIIEEAKLIKA